MNEKSNVYERKKKDRKSNEKEVTKSYSKKNKNHKKEHKKKRSDVKGSRKTKNKTSNRKSKKSKTIKVIFDGLFFVVILCMLGSASLFMVSQRTDKTFLGYRFYDVLTNSMVKTKSSQKGNFKAGDMIIVKSIKPDKVKVNDIITFVPNKEAEDTYLTHRVIKKIPNKSGDSNEKKYPDFITQGDANNAPDPQISGENVIGVVVLAVPKAGDFVKLIRTNGLLSIIFVISLFLLMYVLKGYFISVSRETKNRRKKNAKVKKK
ncbi:MAG: signal peptidase I [Vagococcus sp.]